MTSKPRLPKSKGERTRERIVARVAPLFNQRGFAGASMADLIAATGLRAGGLYRHFEGKEALAIAAFDHAAARHWAFYNEAVAGATGAIDRAVALVDAVASIVEQPIVAGGCPLLNTAVETDDAHPGMPALRARVRRAMDKVIGLGRQILADGIATGELPPSVDAAAEARFAVAAIEGAIMLAKLYNDPSIAREAAAHVGERIRTLAGGPRPRRRTSRKRTR
ncbi:MAG TPA: TetR/AcrR family transcriptional regulator [Gemmatimonadaceae bacterium]|jgi:AcrR family transcriptional regulator|nr:TetR/AcrR family transcriptional regulator [Gemmatimonadaceae bacterium]